MAKQRLTDKDLISGVTLDNLLHFVVTGDTSQNPAGSSYKGSVEQLFNSFSSYTCSYPLSLDTINACNDTITINGDIIVNGSATTINTQIIQSLDNNIVLNYSGTHLTAIGGGITVEDGQSDGVDSSIYTDSDGIWIFNPGLSASTGTINNLTADTISVTTIGSSGDCVNDLYLANLYGCSPIIVWDNLTLSGSVIDAQGGGYLNLRYNNDGIFYLGNDNGNYSDTFIYGENGYLEISSYDPSARINIFTDGGNAGFVLTNDTTFYTNDISIYTDTTSILSTPVAGDGNNILEINNDNILLQGNTKLNVSVGNHSPVGIGSAVSDLLIAVVTGTSYTTDSLRETNPSILSSQYSTIQTGIKNSVALGGYNLNINSDNTAFVDNLNINTIGSGNSIFNLGLDSIGNVVTGVTTTDTYVTGGTYLNGTTTFTNNTGGTFNVTGFTQPFTGNTSASCINDLYVSNIHACSPLNINPLDEGNVYFGSTSGVTIDVSNSRLGIGTESPEYRFVTTGSTGYFYYDGDEVRSTYRQSELAILGPSSGITNVSVKQFPTTGKTIELAMIVVGDETSNSLSWRGFGNSGDTAIYASSSANDLNIINGVGSGTTDNINFFAGSVGNIPNSTPDLHIHGSGTTKGYVGIGTNSPSETLDVSGKTKTTNFQITSGATIGYVLTSSDNSGNATWTPTSGLTGFIEKYSTTLTTPSGTNTITHNLNTTDIQVSLWLVTTGDLTNARVTNRTANTVDIVFSSPPGENVRVVIIG